MVHRSSPKEATLDHVSSEETHHEGEEKRQANHENDEQSRTKLEQIDRLVPSPFAIGHDVESVA